MPTRAHTRAATRIGRLLLAGAALAVLSSLDVSPAVASGASPEPGSLFALADARWSSFPAGPLAARTGAVTLWTGSRLLVWGGISVAKSGACHCQTYLGDGAMYDPRTERWTLMPRSPLSPRFGAAAVWTGRVVLFWGGQTSNTVHRATYTATGASFDPSTDRWTRLNASPLGARAGATALWTGHEAIILGGYFTPNEGSLQQNVTASGAVYDTATGHWSRLPPFPRPPYGYTISITSVWTGHELIVWSRVPGSKVQVGMTWTPGDRSWRSLPAPPDAVVTGYATSTWADGRDVVTGGTDCYGNLACPAELAASADVFDPATDTWTFGPNRSIFVDADLVASTGRSLVVLDASTEIGGSDPVDPGDGIALDPATLTLGPIPPAPANLGLSSALVWTGHTLLLWGSVGATTDTFGLQLSEA